MNKMMAYPKGSSTKLSEHFNSNEFDCKCNRPDCKVTLVDEEHIQNLEALREQCGGRSITVLSGYRCYGHNASIGGAKQSRHMVGDASDIRVSGFTPDVVADNAEGFQGLGRYNTFTHVDNRPQGKARWDLRTKE